LEIFLLILSIPITLLTENEVPGILKIFI
jgi:hypothetical protein